MHEVSRIRWQLFLGVICQKARIENVEIRPCGGRGSTPAASFLSSSAALTAASLSISDCMGDVVGFSHAVVWLRIVSSRDIFAFGLSRVLIPLPATLELRPIDLRPPDDRMLLNLNAPDPLAINSGFDERS